MNFNIVELIKNPDNLNKETMFKLRLIIAQYPYYQSARLLYLKNLYLLNDPLFEKEMRNSSLFITNRNIIFNFFEKENRATSKCSKNLNINLREPQDRTESLINNFLNNNCEKQQPRKTIDASTDYISYMLNEEEWNKNNNSNQEVETEDNDNNISASSESQNHLIDDFIENNNKKIALNENPEYTPEVDMRTDGDSKDSDEDYFTEVLAKIYIQQGRYTKAIEILNKVNLHYPKKK